MKKNQKNIIKILMALAFFTLFTAPAFAESSLFVSTGSATSVTQNTAVLHGTGGVTFPEGCNSFTGYSATTSMLCSSAGTNTTLPLTAYFRYSTLPISPVFCNDIYGSNMVSTKDINLGIPSSVSFSQTITNLSPNTTYYYCAIVSNKNTIAYTSTVQKLHTNCNDTTVETKIPTNIRSTSVSLQGSYCTTKSSVKTAFEYRKAVTGSQPTQTWKKVGETNHTKGSNSNVYGSISFNLTGLAPNTDYEYKATAETSTEKPEGFVEDFTTDPSASGSDGGSYDSGAGGYNSSANNEGNVNNYNGIINTTPLTLGQIIDPPSLAVVHYHEGIETVFARQIVSDVAFAKLYGYQDGTGLQTFAGELAHTFAKTFGYVDGNGKEIRVSYPDVAAYQLQFIGSQLTVYEYYSGKIIDIRNVTTIFKNASGYEYYFQK